VSAKYVHRGHHAQVFTTLDSAGRGAAAANNGGMDYVF
jgi:hypothetical protein